ncbi:hypothetical protein HNR46_000362 [Haloferula luteola]|uniref:Uncharacterized protein n=1 Tax=Haloferula luteola TaxID=595692 RepID=A0A840VB73_9BACT|nr:hypothetical protein [Haloferula luteola]MBB5350141.1 hypothetical protein [Haloferula luteola]
MKHESPDPLENDPLWDLLRQSPARQAGPRLVDDTLRAARLAGQDDPWWKKIVIPVSLGTFASAATALIVGMLVLRNPSPQASQNLADRTPQAYESFEFLDEYARSEAIEIVAENPADYTDAELVSLIAF